MLITRPHLNVKILTEGSQRYHLPLGPQHHGQTMVHKLIPEEFVSPICNRTKQIRTPSCQRTDATDLSMHSGFPTEFTHKDNPYNLRKGHGHKPILMFPLSKPC